MERGTVSEIETLLFRHPGHSFWLGHVRGYASGPPDPAVIEALRPLLGDDDLALALAIVAGDHAVAWTGSKIPALDHRTPLDVLANEPQGRKVLQSLFVQMCDPHGH